MIKSWTGTINTATVSPNETYVLLNKMLTGLLPVDTPKSLNATFPKELLLTVNPQKMLLENVLLLKLLSEGVMKPSSLLHQSFVFQFEYVGTDFQNVSVTPGPTVQGTILQPNTVFAAYCLQLLTKRIRDCLHALQQFFEPKMEDQPTLLGQTLQQLANIYMPEKYADFLMRQSQLLDLNLSTVYDVLPKLSLLLTEILVEIRRFSVIEAAIDIYMDLPFAVYTPEYLESRTITSIKVPNQEVWLTCVEEMLLKAESNTNMILDEVLYKYMVGYYLTHNMCTLLSQDWAYRFQKFGTMFKRLINSTKEPTHKTFLKTLYTDLRSHCEDQSATYSYLECRERMKMSSAILSKLGLLYQFLKTGTEPLDQLATLDVFTSDAEVLMDSLALLEINYLKAFARERSFVEDALQRVTSHIQNNAEKYVSLVALMIIVPTVASSLDPSTVSKLGETYVMAQRATIDTVKSIVEFLEGFTTLLFKDGLVLGLKHGLYPSNPANNPWKYIMHESLAINPVGTGPYWNPYWIEPLKALPPLFPLENLDPHNLPWDLVYNKAQY